MSESFQNVNFLKFDSAIGVFYLKGFSYTSSCSAANKPIAIGLFS